MKGEDIKLLEFLDGQSKRFIIPIYQRNYDWKKKNCECLYNDLVQLALEKNKNHFLGSIVWVDDCNSSSYFTSRIIIDGQQRITTIFLLLLAIYNLLKNNVISLKSSTNIAERIYDSYLIDKNADEGEQYKLIHVKNDREAFKQLFENNPVINSNIAVNYEYFYETLKNEKRISVDDLYDALRRLIIISIRLTSEDNPQLIFESLNSTGLDLSEGDKIRNFVLMGLNSKEQEMYYDKYWKPIEVNTDCNVSGFVRDYLSIKTGKIANQNKVYPAFKEYIKNKVFADEINSLFVYSERYKLLLTGNTKIKGLGGCINRLNRLQTTVTRPFFLEVLRLYDEHKIDNEQILNVFQVIEVYLFRRFIVDLPSNILNKLFVSLYKEVFRLENNDDNFLEKLKYVLLTKDGASRFPKDEEFIKCFSERDVYNFQPKNKIYIFERLENNGTLEDKDVYNHCDDGSYSVEHIMPQTLSSSWKSSLGENFEEIYSTWLHRIANLTLTAYNSKYSNKTFQDKKTMEHGFNDSHIWLNNYISKLDKWGLKELEDRNTWLKKLALKIWKIPFTQYSTDVKEEIFYPFDTNFRGKKIKKFKFKDVTYPAKNFSDMLESLLKMLYEEDCSIIMNIANSEVDDLRKLINVNKSIFRSPKEFVKGCFLEGNTSTERKFYILEKLFEKYNINVDELEICVS